MTDQPTPEAVEAVALHLIRDEVFMRPRTSEQVAADVLPFIRDAIHRDGPDADAIRDALGIRFQESRSNYDLRGEQHRSAKRRIVSEWVVTLDTLRGVGVDEDSDQPGQ